MKSKRKSKISEICKALQNDLKDWDRIPECPEKSPKTQRNELFLSLKKKIDQLT